MSFLNACEKYNAIFEWWELFIKTKLQHVYPYATPGHLNFEVTVGQIPGPWDKIAGQMPGHVERFEFKCPWPRDRKKKGFC